MKESVIDDQSRNPRTRTARRRMREREARRQSILDAAGNVFLEQGISATTVDQIAERAELSKGAIYLYFKSKEELCLALLVEASRVFVREMKQARTLEMPPLEQLQQLIQAYFDFYVRRPDYFRLLFVIEHQPFRGQVADALRAQWNALGKEGLEMLASVIERGIELGAIRPCDPWTTAVSLWTAVTGVIVLSGQEIRWDFVGHLDQQELLRATVRNFLAGIQATAEHDKAVPSTATHKASSSGDRRQAASTRHAQLNRATAEGRG
jgi:AcrR family transcriptional regulator